MKTGRDIQLDAFSLDLYGYSTEEILKIVRKKYDLDHLKKRHVKAMIIAETVLYTLDERRR